jgi:hypothetical protein
MKKIILTIFAAITLNASFGQAFTNGGFENWNTSIFEYPQYYLSNSNYQLLYSGYSSNATKVADAQSGSFAVNLLTTVIGPDTMFAYIANGDPGSMEGGIPYTQKPATLTGYYKCNIPVGDTAIFLVVFKESGLPVSMDIYKFAGTQSGYAPFTLLLNIPALANPDTVIIGAASSNAFVFNGIPGSMLQLDNISFTGVLSQPAQLNGSFETWNTNNIHKPDQWAIGGDTSFRTTDAASGAFAIEMTTEAFSSGSAGASYLTNGTFSSSFGPVGGRPYTATIDTLFGKYKFIPNGIDSATVWINLNNGGVPVGGSYVGLPPAATYTQFSIPFTAGSAPDTLLLVMGSSYGDIDISNAGSQFYVDDLYLASQPLSTPQISNWNAFGLIKVYPNPAAEFTNISWTNNNGGLTNITLNDAMGRLVYENTVSGTGFLLNQINLGGLEKGNYALTLTQNKVHQTRLLIVK